MPNNLIHITYPRVVFEIVEKEAFHSNGEDQHYDGGMNFLGVLGQNQNTQPRGNGARLICSWTGQVTTPLQYSYSGTKKQNVLMDFNGSGAAFSNNDPRYLLPNGSDGLVIDDIQFDDDDGLLMGWCFFKGGIYAWLYKEEYFHKIMLKRAQKHVEQIRHRCKKGEIKIIVKYVARM